MFFHLTIRQLGWTRKGDYGAWARWGLVPVREDGTVAYRWRNGDPRPVHRPTSGKAAPQWCHRAVGFVRAAGPFTLAELADIASWYQEHRVGQYPIDRLEMIAAK